MKTIKILSIRFNYKENTGRTYNILNYLTNRLSHELNGLNEITIQIKNISSMYLNYCHGCAQCFKNGYCDLDLKDSFDKTKKSLLETDLLIISSPIYINNIPGIFKTFLDRLSYWSHIMRLNGCPTILLLTYANNGGAKVSVYLFEILSLLGMNILGIVLIKANDSDEKIIAHINDIIIRYKIRCILSSDKKSNSYLENCFKKYKRIYELNNISNNFEQLYWNEIINSKFKSYHDYINHIENKNERR